jgi:putative salt-induced outer membrane protein YdiY
MGRKTLTRWIVLGLLGVCSAAALAHAQDSGPAPGPFLVQPEVRRLPPIESLPLPAEAAALPAPGESGTPGQIVAAPLEEVVAGPPGELGLWTGSFELGLDGSEGNTQTFNLRFGFDVQRKTEENRFALDLDYHKATSNTMETANQAFLDGRCDQFFPDSPWSAFLAGTVDYDEFSSFDVRVTSHIGFGYELAKSELTCLSGRLGAGCSHEIGSLDKSYVPEAIFGLDFEHQLGKRQKLTATAEYMPDVTGMNDFRLRAKTSWELLIDPQMDLSLKLSVLDRFDSTPNGAKPNDLDYAAVLLWKF